MMDRNPDARKSRCTLATFDSRSLRQSSKTFKEGVWYRTSYGDCPSKVCFKIEGRSLLIFYGGTYHRGGLLGFEDLTVFYDIDSETCIGYGAKAGMARKPEGVTPVKGGWLWGLTTKNSD